MSCPGRYRISEINWGTGTRAQGVDLLGALVFLGKICSHINLFIQQMGERMVRVHDLRRQHRQDLFFEIFFYIFLLLLL